MADEQDQLASPTLAELYLKQGSPGKAVQVLSQALARRPEDMDLRRKLTDAEQEWFKLTEAGGRKELVKKLSQVLEAVRKERRG
jgi:hypothetical protein